MRQNQPFISEVRWSVDVEKRGPAFFDCLFVLRQIWTMYNFNFPEGVRGVKFNLSLSLSMYIHALECNLSLTVTVQTFSHHNSGASGSVSYSPEHGRQLRRKSSARGDSKHGTPPPIRAAPSDRRTRHSNVLPSEKRVACHDRLALRVLWRGADGCGQRDLDKMGSHEAAHVTIPPTLALTLLLPLTHTHTHTKKNKKCRKCSLRPPQPPPSARAFLDMSCTITWKWKRQPWWHLWADMYTQRATLSSCLSITSMPHSSQNDHEFRIKCQAQQCERFPRATVSRASCVLTTSGTGPLAEHTVPPSRETTSQWH